MKCKHSQHILFLTYLLLIHEFKSRGYHHRCVKRSVVEKCVTFRLVKPKQRGRAGSNTRVCQFNLLVSLVEKLYCFFWNTKIHLN